jgi:hypothetical protein
MNHNPVNQCASPACSIYQYWAAVRGNLHVDFLPLNPHIDNNDKQVCAETGEESVGNTGGAKIVISDIQEDSNVQG